MFVALTQSRYLAGQIAELLGNRPVKKHTQVATSHTAPAPRSAHTHTHSSTISTKPVTTHDHFPLAARQNAHYHNTRKRSRSPDPAEPDSASPSGPSQKRWRPWESAEQLPSAPASAVTVAAPGSVVPHQELRPSAPKQRPPHTDKGKGKERAREHATVAHSSTKAAPPSSSGGRVKEADPLAKTSSDVPPARSAVIHGLAKLQSAFEQYKEQIEADKRVSREEWYARARKEWPHHYLFPERYEVAQAPVPAPSTETTSAPTMEDLDETEQIEGLPRIYLQDACLLHKYIRTRDKSNVFERPERLRAVNVGIAAAYARLEFAAKQNTAKARPKRLGSDKGRPFDIVRSAAKVDFATHVAAQHVHGVVNTHDDDDDGEAGGDDGAYGYGMGYTSRLTLWCARSKDEIARTGSEIPDVHEQDLYRAYGFPSPHNRR
jgi:hypothetical protein